MRKRVTRLMLILGAVVALACSVGIVLWIGKTRTLTRYRQHIEVTYASAISLIERRAQEVPLREELASPEAWTRQEEILTEIENALAAPEIVDAFWSLDGHHGSTKS